MGLQPEIHLWNANFKVDRLARGANFKFILVFCSSILFVIAKTDFATHVLVDSTYLISLKHNNNQLKHGCWVAWFSQNLFFIISRSVDEQNT